MKKEKISIYIHWPFCLKKCPYCDFNSFVARDIDHDKWAEAYKKVITGYYSEILQHREISTIFFGGGTPSLATPNMIESIIDTLNDVSGVSPDTEITLEANPTSVEAKKFSNFKAAGINRVSMGIQSLRDNNLKFLGRNHSVDESRKAIAAVKKSFHNYSLDFIYALPHQTLSNWKMELQEAIDLASGHMSLYQLTIEEGTKFGMMAKHGLLNEIDQEVATEMFEMTNDMTRAAGLYRYEVSNHAKPGYESLHNLNYWRYSDYLGIGPGAHGRHNKVMTTDRKQPEAWLHDVITKGNALETNSILTDDEIRLEKILMGMRTIEGVDVDLVDGSKLQELLESFLIKVDKNKVKATNKGLLVLNSLVEALVA